MTAVAVNTYTHSVTYVADNILKSLKDIIRESGLDPTKFVGSWSSNLEAIKTWMQSQHLQCVKLEIYDPTGAFLTRWDIEISYEWGGGDGNFWLDTEQLKYHILKLGVFPSTATYRLLLTVKPGAPTVPGWGDAEERSTAGFVRQSLGSTINHNGISANASYWRKAG